MTELLDKNRLWIPDTNIWTPEDIDLWKPPEDVDPLYYSKPLLPLSRVDTFSKFVESGGLVPTRGKRVGLSPKMLSWQTFSLRLMMEENLDGFLRFRSFLLGIPRKNGKSFIGSGLALHRLLLASEGDQIFGAARDKDQAKIVLEFAKSQVNNSEILSRYLKPQRDRIINKQSNVEYRVVPADADALQGLGPSLVIFDEIHALRQTRETELWNAFMQGSGDREESQVVAITTAGDRDTGLLANLYERLADESEDPDFTSNFGGVWFGAKATDDISSPKVWRKANPNVSEGLLSEGELRSSFRDADKYNELDVFKRYRLNMFVKKGAVAIEFMTAERFDKCYDPNISEIPLGSKVWAGFDGSTRDDSTALSIISEDGTIQVLGLWESDGSNDYMVPRSEVDDLVNFMFGNYDVQMFWTDANYFRDAVERWGDTYYGKVASIPQSAARMIPITREFVGDWYDNEYKHNNDPNLRTHFMNARRRDDGRPIKSKPSSKDKIDIVISVILAAGARRNGLIEERKANDWFEALKKSKK